MLANGELGALRVTQSAHNGSVDPYLLRRIEQLGGTIAEVLGRLRNPDGSNGDSGSHLPRILFLTHYFPPEGNAPATRVHALCRQWVAEGQSVTVITGVPNVPSGVVYDGYENRLFQRERLDGIDIIRVWTYLAANRGTLRRILNYVSYMVTATLAASFAPRCELVVATSPQLFCGWAGAVVARLRRVPFVLEIRDLWPDSIATVGAMRNRRMLRLLTWLERRLYQAADHIVTVGEGYRDELRRKGVPADKMSVIPNGVDPRSATTATGADWVRPTWMLGSRFVCAYVGTVGMASGLDVVLRAAEQLRAQGDTRICFLVVGDGAVRADLQRQAEAAALDNVIFTGRQEKHLISDILTSADACLVHLRKRPLFTTVLPSKLFEAAAMARPIVLGVEGHAAALVRQADCGICIEPENAQALVHATQQLAADAELCAQLGNRGRAFFSQHYDRQTLARRYRDLLQRVWNAAPRHRRVALLPPHPLDPNSTPPADLAPRIEPAQLAPAVLSALRASSDPRG
jgi:glycosyltransferase involved in cell wall biosynthesis